MVTNNHRCFTNFLHVYDIYAMTLNSFKSLLHFAIVSLCSSVCAFFASVKAAGNIFGSGAYYNKCCVGKSKQEMGLFRGQGNK